MYWRIYLYVYTYIYIFCVGLLFCLSLIWFSQGTFWGDKFWLATNPCCVCCSDRTAVRSTWLSLFLNSSSRLSLVGRLWLYVSITHHYAEEIWAIFITKKKRIFIIVAQESNDRHRMCSNAWNSSLSLSSGYAQQISEKTCLFSREFFILICQRLPNLSWLIRFFLLLLDWARDRNIPSIWCKDLCVTY